MKNFLVVSGFFCAFFSITSSLAMEEQVCKGVVSIPNAGQVTIKSGDRIVFKRIIEHREEFGQEELPPQSLGCKVFDALWPGIACIGTMVALGLGEIFTISALHAYEQKDNPDNSTSIIAGTTVGLGICSLGVCTYGCGVALKKMIADVSAKKNKQKMHFLTGDGELPV